ncbi:MAG: GNAT family N-acetyltransferase [Gammaproteobacteria bacterium]|nr:GNAT family N-acetyltransferase [Gammaproteobacteria bacterium]
MLTLRCAQAADVPLILALIRELADYEHLLHAVDATEETLGAALFAATPRVFCDIAEWHDGTASSPAGFALWFYNFSTFRGRHGIYLEDLYVKPEYRGRGIGKALLVQLAERCVREGLTRLEWAVLDWNEPALRFYKSLGAVAHKDWILHRVTGETLQTLGRSDRQTSGVSDAGAATTHESPAPPRR